MPEELVAVNPFLRICEDHGWTWLQLATQMKVDYLLVYRMEHCEFIRGRILPKQILRGLERIGEDPDKVQAEVAEYLAQGLPKYQGYNRGFIDNAS
jgi:hypothetical protein